MKHAVIGLVSALAVAIAAPLGAAKAADMPLKAPRAPTVTNFNWTGFYIGGNVGGGWSDTNFSGSATDLGVTSTFSGSNHYSGALGGGQIGANYQFTNNWVAGIEADGDWANLSGTANVCTFSAGVVTGCASDKNKFSDFGTVRGRLGYAVNNVLLYGTGGWAWGNTKTTSALTCAGPGCPAVGLAFTGGATSASATPSGWVAGAGVEWAVAGNWILRFEYLHLQFNGVGESYASTGTLIGVPFTLTSSSTSNIGVNVARVGASYLFH
ncbi:MAG: outer membrane beta-barrel protein [Xanthobacteraceae bacterium]